RCQGATVKRSILANNNGPGFWADETVDKPYVLSTLIQTTSTHGIQIELCSDGLVANCKIVVGNGHGIMLQNSDTCRIWNNTIADVGGNTVTGSARMINLFQDARGANDGTSAGRDTRQSQTYYDV